jgi:hypothetical protein
MTEQSTHNESLSWKGMLLIVGVVGLNTAFMLYEHGYRPTHDFWAWLAPFSQQFGLLVIGVIVVHLRSWQR